MFVTFEGPEGAGKSTVLAKVAEALRADGRSVVETREPGSGEIGARIREILLGTAGEAPHPECELFLFLADRAQHVATVIKPALERGAVVLCDRFADSTVVYQGYGRGLDVPLLKTLNRAATGGLTPDLTLLFDLPTEVGLARLGDKDRMDSESAEFHERVREGFLKEASLDPMRWWILDATQPVDAVTAAALQAIQTLD